MKSRFYLIGILIIIALCCIESCRRAGTWLVKEDAPVKADALVLLMGSISDN